MLILKGYFGFLADFIKCLKLYSRSREIQKSVSRACSSQDSHSRRRKRPKTSLSQQAPALYDRRGGCLEEECRTPSASCLKALAEEVMLPIDMQKTPCGTRVGRSKTSEISDRRGIWLHSNIQNCTGVFLQKKRVLRAKKSIIFDIFFSTILYNVMWELLIASTELYREVRRHYKGSLLC